MQALNLTVDYHCNHMVIRVKTLKQSNCLMQYMASILLRDMRRTKAKHENSEYAVNENAVNDLFKILYNYRRVVVKRNITTCKHTISRV